MVQENIVKNNRTKKIQKNENQELEQNGDEEGEFEPDEEDNVQDSQKKKRKARRPNVSMKHIAILSQLHLKHAGNWVTGVMLDKEFLKYRSVFGNRTAIELSTLLSKRTQQAKGQVNGLAGNRGTILRQNIVKNNNRDSGKKITKKKAGKVSPEKKAVAASDLAFNRRYATNSSEQTTASDFRDFSNRNLQTQAYTRRNSNIYLNAQKSKADIIHFRLQMNVQQAMQLEQAELAHVITKEMNSNSTMLHILLEHECGTDVTAKLLKHI